MTQVPRNLTARKLITALQKDGFSLVRSRGSHHIYIHPDGRRVNVSYHRSGDTFPIGTLKKMIDDIGWGDEELRRLKLIT